MNCSGTNFDISPPYDANSLTDFEYELQIAQANGVQNPEIETVFLQVDFAGIHRYMDSICWYVKCRRLLSVELGW